MPEPANPAEGRRTFGDLPLSPEGHGSLAGRATAGRNLGPQDASEHARVIYAPHAARLVRQHRFDGDPFIIAEFVMHDSMFLAACYCLTVLLARSFRYPSAA